jgi:hypothetical protein
VLEKNAQLLVYKWLKSLCFPDGHASNISRLVNTKEWRLYGMKSYDYHVFMQTPIPLAFRDLLPKGIWDAPASWMLITLKDLKRISSRQYANLRWYSLHHFLTRWSIYPYIYHWGKSWRTGPVQMDVSIREVRYYRSYVIHN